MKKELEKMFGDIPKHYIHVNIAEQKLDIIKSNNVQYTFPVSTSRFGIGSKEGSFKTPTGIHRVVSKIGDGAYKGRIFKDRKDTGKDWVHGNNEENLILTRIIRLEGLETGVNKGHGIDSYERYIYIHGTNREDLIGTPNSHGCVCMTNDHIIELFDQVGEGTIVYID